MGRTSFVKTCLSGVIVSVLLSTTVNASTGTVTGNRVNVRTNASITSEVIGSRNTGEKVTILSKEGDWFKIQLGENKTAFMSSTYIKEDAATVVATVTTPTTQTDVIEVKDTATENSVTTETTETNAADTDVEADTGTPSAETTDASTSEVTPEIYGIVTADVLNLRSTPSTSSNDNITAKVNAYEKVTILKTEGEWYYISTASNQMGYVFKEYIQITENVTDAAPSETGTKMVAFAKQFLGNRYVYGGNSLTNGVDCSGFAQQIFKNFGYQINRTASTQRKNGTIITEAELQAGDLVFYGYSGKISHVAIYIGDGKIIHANTSSTGIIISNLHSSGKPFIGCNRILK